MKKREKKISLVASLTLLALFLVPLLVTSASADDVVVAMNNLKSPYKGIVRVYKSGGGCIDLFPAASGWSIDAVASIGDRDGDGKDEVLAVLNKLDYSKSIVRLYYSDGGYIDLFDTDPIDAGHPDFGAGLFSGPWRADAVASIGDLDGDGKDEVLAAINHLASPYYGIARIYTSGGGYIDLFYGSPWSIDAVAGMGDWLFDADDKGEALAAINKVPPYKGIARVYTSGGVYIDLFNGSPWSIDAVAGVGDWDGDGKDEALAAINELKSGGKGIVRLYKSGATVQQLFIGGNYTADAVAGTGNWDGDTKDDVVVALNQRKSGGRGIARVYKSGGGSKNLFSANGWRIHAVAGIDWDGDGKGDVVAALNQRKSGGKGIVRVYKNGGKSEDLFNAKWWSIDAVATLSGVTVADTIPPEITILGDNPAIVEGGDAYVDAGATAEDDVDGSVAVSTSGVEDVDVYTLGDYTITYTAEDAAGNVATATRTVTVEDTTPPELSVSVIDPPILWPPNHNMVNAITYSVVDIIDASPTVVIDVIVTDVEGGAGDPENVDVDTLVDGVVSLRAERSGKGTGRIYDVVITATDASGNSTESDPIEVLVPHDQGRKKK